MLKYAAISSCLALLQRSRACAAHNFLVLETKVLKLSSWESSSTIFHLNAQEDFTAQGDQRPQHWRFTKSEELGPMQLFFLALSLIHI